ncbi:unnamed protein product [Symbiodinium necroappetens]|uniref:Uncharacterized protein n=1 Tax=Symbiodinium necroappetens TaxID=1628268 RepID=A0A813AKE7_9DINO|nr:unnamed protein product [Symbiodinium necroappetens]
MTVEAGFYSKKDMKEVLGWTARDKYEASVKLYWVDTKISGKYEEEAAESYKESVTGEVEANEVSVGGLMTADDPLQMSGETEDVDEEESDDEGDRESNSRSRKDKPDKAAEEAAMEDIENVKAVMTNILKTCTRLDSTAEKLREIGTDDATKSADKLGTHKTTLMKFHDELADLKSHFDGGGDFDAKTLG